MGTYNQWYRVNRENLKLEDCAGTANVIPLVCNSEPTRATANFGQGRSENKGHERARADFHLSRRGSGAPTSGTAVNRRFAPEEELKRHPEQASMKLQKQDCPH